jgi:hypothetical protein
MIRTTPFRLMTLQCSQMGFTEGFTFMSVTLLNLKTVPAAARLRAII